MLEAFMFWFPLWKIFTTTEHFPSSMNYHLIEHSAINTVAQIYNFPALTVASILQGHQCFTVHSLSFICLFNDLSELPWHCLSDQLSNRKRMDIDFAGLKYTEWRRSWKEKAQCVYGVWSRSVKRKYDWVGVSASVYRVTSQLTQRISKLHVK